MKILKYFMECYFNQTFGFDELDERIDDFKDEIRSTQEEMIRELSKIIQKKNYTYVSKFIAKHGDKIFDKEKTEKFINYLYDRLLNRPTKVKANDFAGKQCKIVLCPICTHDPEAVLIPSLIDKATVIEKNIKIYICKPCKLVWLDENDIRADNAYDYKKFMKMNGLKGLWKELTDVEEL